MAKKMHTSARGRQVNFDELFLKNRKTIAVTGGGASMNAKGDTLGPGGKILQTVEERDRVSNPQPVPEGAAYNQDNPNAVKHVSVKQNIDDLAALISSPQTKAKELAEDDALDAKTPAQVIKELSVKIDEVNPSVDSDKSNTKNKRKIVDTDE